LEVEHLMIMIYFLSSNHIITSLPRHKSHRFLHWIYIAIMQFIILQPVFPFILLSLIVELYKLKKFTNHRYLECCYIIFPIYIL